MPRSYSRSPSRKTERHSKRRSRSRDRHRISQKGSGRHQSSYRHKRSSPVHTSRDKKSSSRYKSPSSSSRYSRRRSRSQSRASSKYKGSTKKYHESKRGCDSRTPEKKHTKPRREKKRHYSTSSSSSSSSSASSSSTTTSQKSKDKIKVNPKDSKEDMKFASLETKFMESQIKTNVLNELNSDEFTPKPFSSFRKNLPGSIKIDLDKQIVLVPKVQQTAPLNAVFHPNLFRDDFTRLEKWTRKLFIYRQRSFQHELRNRCKP